MHSTTSPKQKLLSNSKIRRTIRAPISRPLLSTGWPLSINVTSAPSWARTRAANKPEGPLPTTAIFGFLVAWFLDNSLEKMLCPFPPAKTASLFSLQSRMILSRSPKSLSSCTRSTRPTLGSSREIKSQQRGSRLMSFWASISTVCTNLGSFNF